MNPTTGDEIATKLGLYWSYRCVEIPLRGGDTGMHWHFGYKHRHGLPFTVSVKVTDCEIYVQVETCDDKSVEKISGLAMPRKGAIYDDIQTILSKLHELLEGANQTILDAAIDGVKHTTVEEHRRRHLRLHHCLDELLADYLQHTRKSFTETTAMELLQWSNEQMQNPTEVP